MATTGIKPLAQRRGKRARDRNEPEYRIEKKVFEIKPEAINPTIRRSIHIKRTEKKINLSEMSATPEQHFPRRRRPNRERHIQEKSRMVTFPRGESFDTPETRF